MRILMATMVAFFVISSGPTAWSQSDDPFGGGGSDPFAAPPDPFAAPPARAGQPNAAPAKQRPADKTRRTLVDQAKKVLAEGGKPARVRPPRDDEMERRIMAALRDETSWIFIETPLEEALQSISKTHNIPILADRRALEEIGLSAEEPVNLSLNNVSLRSFLRLMLRPLDLTYMIKDGVMQVTTAEAAEQNLVLKMYVLPNNLAAKSETVIKVLTATVVPDAWEGLGGPSSAMAIDHVLVISTTSDVQDQTHDFLANLIEKYGK